MPLRMNMKIQALANANALGFPAADAKCTMNEKVLVIFTTGPATLEGSRKISPMFLASSFSEKSPKVSATPWTAWDSGNHRGGGRVLPVHSEGAPGDTLRDGPTTATTIIEFISLGPTFRLRGTPGCCTKCPFYTVKHRESTKILHLMCHQVPL